MEQRVFHAGVKQTRQGVQGGSANQTTDRDAPGPKSLESSRYEIGKPFHTSDEQNPKRERHHAQNRKREALAIGHDAMLPICHPETFDEKSMPPVREEDKQRGGSACCKLRRHKCRDQGATQAKVWEAALARCCPVRPGMNAQKPDPKNPAEATVLRMHLCTHRTQK